MGEHHLAMARNFLTGEWMSYGAKCERAFGLEEDFTSSTGMVFFYKSRG